MVYSIHIRIFCHWIQRVDNKKMTIGIDGLIFFFGGKIQFCLYMIVWTLILWFPWFIVILGARLKKYLQEVQSNFHVTYTQIHTSEMRAFMLDPNFFISFPATSNYFVWSKVAQNEKKTYYLVLVFVELFCWTISSDFWRVYYIYLNYLLMDSEYYQKSSYLYSKSHVRDDYVYLRDNNDYCLDFDNIRNRIISLYLF